jgi:hypothetical protein
VLEDGALDSYLLWEFSRTDIHEGLKRSPIDRNRISGSIALARELIIALSLEVKMKLVASQKPLRADKLRTKRWTPEEYPVSRLGTVLPYMGDLPIEEIAKSFVEVADFVRQQAERKAALTSVQYICSLSRIADILQTIPVMVIEPGSEQRRPDVIRERCERDLPIFPAEGYIEDGNHRALALVMADSRRQTVPAYVGRDG